MTTNALIATHKNWLTPSTDIDQYIAKVRQIPALDAEEERKLAIALQETNDINAAQTLIVHHLKFVVPATACRSATSSRKATSA